MAPRPRTTLLAVASGALALGTLAAGCGGDDIDGSVSVAGSSNLLPMVSSVAGNFSAANPLARVRVDMTGTGAGITALCDDLVDIAGASREMKDREKQQCEESGVRPVRLLMARDALVFFTSVRTASPACLNANDIYALAGPEAAGLGTWRAAQRVARVLGSRTALPDQPLVVVSPKIGSGTRQLVEDSIIEPPAKRRSTDPSVRSDAVTVPSDQVMLAEVLRAPTALAFGGYATVEPWKDNIRAIAIDGDSGCVVPTEQTIRDGSYPLARSLYAYVNVDAARNDPTVGAFAEALVDSAANPGDGAGVISLDPEKAAATADAWGSAVSDGDLTGT